MNGKVIQLAVNMTPTGALVGLRDAVTAESRQPAPLLPVPLEGRGFLEFRVRRVPQSLMLPPHLKFQWCVIEVFTVDERVVKEEFRASGLKATRAEAFTEAEACITALEVERGE